MFFIRLLRRSFVRQLRRRSLIALTVALCASISVAMLGVVLDVGDKLNAELTNYGSNIVVQPRAGAVVDNLYETNKDKEAAPFLDEKEVTNIKTIFWADNILVAAPYARHQLDTYIIEQAEDTGARNTKGLGEEGVSQFRLDAAFEGLLDTGSHP